MPNLLDNTAKVKKHKINPQIKITGVDEVGRGAIAGPIVSASFTTTQYFLQNLLININKSQKYKSTAKIDRLRKLVVHDLTNINSIFLNQKEEKNILETIDESILENLLKLNDSKKVTKINREKLYKVLTKIGEYKIGIVENTEIDKVGLQKANLKSMVLTIPSQIAEKHLIITDHLDISKKEEKPLLTANNTAKYLSFDKGDLKSFCIASASIIAKVSRDKIMNDLHIKYPIYGFSEHVGYGTKKHLDVIKKNGPCKVHRLSYKIFKNANNYGSKLQ